MKRNVNKPKALQPGDTVGIVSPAGALKPDSLQPAIHALQDAGFHVRLGKHVYERDGYLAGKDGARADDFIAMLQNDVQAIVCARGGYGSQRILPTVQQYIANSEPKLLVGYSDITVLHSVLQRAGWVSLHGPMPTEWQRHSIAFSLNMLLRMMQGWAPSAIPLPPGVQPITLRPGRAQGRLVGGNLTMVTTMLGTPYEIDTTDAILVLEDVGEHPYRIDRMLSTLQLAGKLDDVKGIVFGNFTQCEPPSGGPEVMAEDVITAFVTDVSIPVLWQYPVGHGQHNVPLPLGLDVELDADKGDIVLLSSPTN